MRGVGAYVNRNGDLLLVIEPHTARELAATLRDTRWEETNELAGVIDSALASGKWPLPGDEEPADA